MLWGEKGTNEDRFPTLTSSGQSLEQRPLSTEEHTDGGGLDMLLTMCYMSNTIMHSAVSVICDGAVVVHWVNLHVSNNRQVKLTQRINFSAAVSQNKQTDKQETISSIITVLKRSAHSNYISNNLIILSVCQVSVDKTNNQRGEGGRVSNTSPAMRNIKNKCANYYHGVCVYTCMLRERFTYLCVQAERGTKSAELLISH